jgi:hypothetical protein
LTVQALLGAFDTLVFHEWRARLPAQPTARLELRLHAFRDFVYAALFFLLPWRIPRGSWVWALWVALGFEIVTTLTDFFYEPRARAPLGGVAPAEIVTHGLMAIVYGAMLALLIPLTFQWQTEPTQWATHDAIGKPWRLCLMFLAAGVAISGVRDLTASFGVKWAAWPWRRDL